MRARLPELRQRGVVVFLVSLVLARIALPLAVLAGSGTSLVPGFPRYDYDPLAGDAYGYYSATRELLATPLRLGWALPGVVVALAILAGVFARWRARPTERAGLMLIAVWCAASVAAILALRMRSAGAPTIGWPLTWSLPLFPYRALGLPLDPDVAFVFGLGLSLAANAVTVISTFLLGLWASGRREVGLVAAGLFAFWPVLALIVGRTREFGTWNVDLGLSLYSEPLSTALVTTACAILVRSGLTPKLAVASGALLGFSVAVRLSNVLVAGVAVAFALFASGRRAALWLTAAGLAFVPLVLGYWPKGYDALPESAFRDDAFGLEYAVPAWRDSAVWGPSAFVALVPLAVAGLFFIRRARAWLLSAWILSTAGLYTFYYYTPLHPRFLLVVLPAVFVLWAAGALALRDRALYGSFMPRS